jgi:sialate O-acetylesterase
MRRPLLRLAALFAINASAHADVRMNNVFGEHMVLQRDMPVKVWGQAAPGEKVAVAFAGQCRSATADARGNWSVQLGAMKANATPQELVVTGTSTVRLGDILVGDVWLCSGQSNMAFALGGCDAQDDIRNADLPQVRYRSYFEHFAGTPQDDLPPGGWAVMSPGSAAGCTAVGFYFARKINTETRVPIGLLESTVGGTEIECWMPPEAFTEFPACLEAGKRLKDAVDQYKKNLPAALAELEKWIPKARQALATDADVPTTPRFPQHPNEDRGGNWMRTQSLYNGMIHPITPFAIKGVLWYQGENNGGEEDTYFQKKKAMIGAWRKLWGYDFPFYFVQLANHGKPGDDPSGGERQWQYGRMGQLKCLAIPKTGMAVTIDVGDADDIHPKNKKDVGERLARWALAKDYGKPVVCSGPLYKGMKIEGGKIRISFDSTGGGLIIGKKVGREPTAADSGGKLKRFAIAGKDKKWLWADAVIERDTVVVSSPQVPDPVAVRYAFTMNPEGANLYNKEGLPASPFRTDSW